MADDAGAGAGNDNAKPSGPQSRRERPIYRDLAEKCPYRAESRARRAKARKIA